MNKIGGGREVLTYDGQGFSMESKTSPKLFSFLLSLSPQVGTSLWNGTLQPWQWKVQQNLRKWIRISLVVRGANLNLPSNPCQEESLWRAGWAPPRMRGAALRGRWQAVSAGLWNGGHFLPLGPCLHSASSLRSPTVWWDIMWLTFIPTDSVGAYSKPERKDHWEPPLTLKPR